MHYVGKSKVGEVNPNPYSSYPLIRLSQQYSDFIGKTAHIFKAEHQGQQVLYILFDNGEETAPNFMQSVYNFIQPKTEINLGSRLSAIEFNIEDIKKLIFQNNSLFNPQSTKNRENKAPESGFEPESEPRQGPMIGHYTTRAA